MFPEHRKLLPRVEVHREPRGTYVPGPYALHAQAFHLQVLAQIRPSHKQDSKVIVEV